MLHDTQSRTVGSLRGRARAGTKSTGSHAQATVCPGLNEQKGLTQAPTLVLTGQSGRRSRSALEDVESAQPSKSAARRSISAAWSTSPAWSGWPA